MKQKLISQMRLVYGSQNKFRVAAGFSSSPDRWAEYVASTVEKINKRLAFLGLVLKLEKLKE